MPLLEIKSHRTGEVLFAGQFATARACIEQAVKDGICLDYADLRHTNLCQAALDGITLRHALLDSTNLTGANLSEAQLDGTHFQNATFHSACLCESSLSHCDFRGCSFGATDITAATIDHSLFSTLSAFALNFIDTDSMRACQFYDDPHICPFSKPPLTILGLDRPVVLLDEHLKIGGIIRTYRDWFSHINDNSPPNPAERDAVHTFFRKYRPLLREMHEDLHRHARDQNLQRIGEK